MRAWHQLLFVLHRRSREKERQAFYAGRRSALVEVQEMLTLSEEMQAVIAALLSQVQPKKRG